MNMFSNCKEALKVWCAYQGGQHVDCGIVTNFLTPDRSMQVSVHREYLQESGYKRWSMWRENIKEVQTKWTICNNNLQGARRVGVPISAFSNLLNLFKTIHTAWTPGRCLIEVELPRTRQCHGCLALLGSWPPLYISQCNPYNCKCAR